ncbi:GDP-mannose mannosyl hydrolase [Chromobacterium violaceum]|uniref:GDP-mannose mannosyl hydrolase n=1 Tax=Chromobacterium violaceum TaxID=536 RepID=UPI000B222862|nr:GDP-mannose mannosyl hydrolase [Chromobacterium violaceum]MCD0491982.1 GDP-mannose mannosyl hydrolase [Chromobacterium violaceum]
MSIKLASTDFMHVVKHAPLISIDFIIENENGEYLLGLRKNQPAAGYWFVLGGRIRKNESIDSAFLRLSNEELGIAIERSEAKPFGVWEHFYNTNAYEEEGFGTHYIVLAYKIKLSLHLSTLPNLQHTEYRWIKRAEVIEDPSIHDNSRAYFIEQ